MAYNYIKRSTRKKKTGTTAEDKLQALYDILGDAGVTPPPIENKPNFINRLAQFLQVGETAPAVSEFLKTGSIGKGLSKYGETAAQRGTFQGGPDYSYADLLKEKGVGELGSMKLPVVGKVTGRGALGLLGDVFLDPTTYLTFGTSALGKVAGKKTLTEASEKIASELAQKAGSKVITPTIREAARKTALEAPDVLGRTTAEQAAKGQRSLLNFMGQPILPKSVNVKAYEGLEGLGRKLGEAAEGEGLASIPGKIYQTTSDLFRTTAKPLSKWGDKEFAEKWSRLTEAEQVYKNAKAVGVLAGEESAESVTKSLRSLLKGSTDIKEYEKTMTEIVDLVEKKTPLGKIPEAYQPIAKELKIMSKAFGERWLKSGGAKMTYDNIAYLPHVMNSKVKDLMIKKGGWGRRALTSNTPSDDPRNWIKFIDTKGNEVVGHIGELKQRYKLEELNIKGLPPGLFSGNQAYTLQQVQKILAKKGETLKFNPVEKMWNVVRGYYSPLKRRLTVASKNAPEKVFSTLEHEITHSKHGLIGEILELNRTFTGRRGGKNKALQEGINNAVESAKLEWEDLAEMVNPRFNTRRLLNQMTSDDKKYLRYIKEPTELLAHAAQKIYELGDEAAQKIPKTAQALEDMKRVYSNITGSPLPKFNEIPPDKFRAGIDRLYVDKSGNIFKIEGATVKEINTVTQRDYGVDLFSTNIPLLEFELSTRVANKEAGKEFFESIKEVGEVASKAPRGWRGLSLQGLEETPQMVQSAAKELRNSGLVFPPEIADRIDVLYKNYFGDKGIREVMNLYDKVQNLWKGSVTAIFPAFHGRNFISNVWQNYLGGVKNPIVYAKATAIRIKVASGAQLSKAEQELWDRFVKQGLSGYGYFKADMTKAYEKGLPNKTLMGKALDLPRKGFEGGRLAGNIVEDVGKLAHFIDKTGKGFSDFKAASSVRKYLFDYSDLTTFEKNIMKRIMPFYTFSRKNLPMELEAFVHDPSKFSKLVKTMESGGFEFGEDKNLPTWLQNQPIIKKEGEGGEQRIGYGFDIPAFDILNYIESGMGGGVDVRRSLEKSVGRLAAPVIKTPLEWMSGKHWYYGKDLKDTATVYPIAAKALKEIGIDKALGIFEKTSKSGEKYYATSQPEMWHVFKSLFGRGYAQISAPQEYKGSEEQLRDFLFGVSTKGINPQDEEDSRNYELIKKIGEWMLRRGLIQKYESYYKKKE